MKVAKAIWQEERRGPAARCVWGIMWFVAEEQALRVPPAVSGPTAYAFVGLGCATSWVRLRFADVVADEEVAPGADGLTTGARR